MENKQVSRREIIRLAGLAGIAGGLSINGLEHVAVAQTTQPATKPIGNQSRNFAFELDKQIDLEGRMLTNADGERWMELWNMRFSSSKAGELKGVLYYIPYYKSGIVSVVAVDFLDAEGKTIAQAKVECPSRTGDFHWGIEAAISMPVEFQVRFAPDQRIAKFRLSLIEEAKKPDANPTPKAER